MKVLLGYDGSDGGATALADLARAGIPRESEVIVLSAADVWPHLPAESYAPMEAGALARLPVNVQRAHLLAMEAMKEAAATAEQGAMRVRELLPDLSVRAEAFPGSPADALLKTAEDWSADLVVTGAVARSRFERLVLGSVSQSVLTAAPCSVRVARPGRDGRKEGIRLVVGVDGSSGAAAAVEAIALRAWPRDTTVYVICAVDVRLTTMIPRDEQAQREAGDEDDPVPAWVRAMGEGAAGELRRTGLLAEAVFPEGDPKELVVEEAKTRGADCIFLGARGHSGIRRLLLGSVSQAVAARAPCSVEIVRA